MTDFHIVGPDPFDVAAPLPERQMLFYADGVVTGTSHALLVLERMVRVGELVWLTPTGPAIRAGRFPAWLARATMGVAVGGERLLIGDTPAPWPSTLTSVPARSRP